MLGANRHIESSRGSLVAYIKDLLERLKDPNHSYVEGRWTLAADPYLLLVLYCAWSRADCVRRRGA
jgi:hypothetical protein